MVTHVVKQNKIILAFQSPLTPDNELYGRHLVRHGDGVKDVAFTVDDIEHVVDQAKSKGGQVVKDIWTETDEHGSVRMAVIQTVSFAGIHDPLLRTCMIALLVR